MDTDDWDPEDLPSPLDCVCEDPDPTTDEPWVPVVCGNCGGLL